MKKSIFLIFFLFLGCPLGFCLPDESGVNIGVLAHKGLGTCLEMWNPTATYLSNRIPGKTFRIVPLKFDQIFPAVQKKEIQFLVCNPSIFVELKTMHGATPLATLVNDALGKGLPFLGGVIFTRADRNDINSLNDLRGKRILAVDPGSFGGWRAAWLEIKRAGINPDKDFSSVLFLGDHNEVASGIWNRFADAGTVRADTLERLELSHKIKLADFKILNERKDAPLGFPFNLSTDLYPEWPFAALPHTPADLSKKVTLALFQMPEDDPAAKASLGMGWDIPSSYQTINDCLKELQLPPFADEGKITLGAVVRKYRTWLIAIVILLTLDLLALFMVLKTNRDLVESQIDLQEELIERIQAEEKFEILNIRDQLLLSSAGEGIIGIDQNGLLTFVNPAACKMLGYRQEELIGKSCHNTLHHTKMDGSPYPTCECPISPAFKGGKAYRSTMEHFFRKDGSWFPAELVATPIIDGGQPLGAVLLFQDISERQRTLNELKTAKEAAEAGHQAKRDFLATVSHELRTPMNGIMGMATLLATTDLTPLQKEYVQTISSSSEALLHQINSILDFSKIEAEKIDLECIPFSLSQLLDEVNRLLNVQAQRKNLEFWGSLSPQIPATLVGDPTRLRQVLLNLGGNAVKFTQIGKVILDAIFERETKDVVTIRFEVTDTGIGISPPAMDRLFRSFSQADSSMSRKFGGTGLGLVISKRLVVLMGGKIGVNSKEGAGSTFWCSIPFAKPGNPRNS